MTSKYGAVELPEEKLASLMAKDLAVSVGPHALRMFVLLNWDLISAYSHAIHDAATAKDAPWDGKLPGNSVAEKVA